MSEKGYIAICINCGHKQKPLSRKLKETCTCCNEPLVATYAPKKPCPKCGIKKWELIIEE